jgi:hypothetical protein
VNDPEQGKLEYWRDCWLDLASDETLATHPENLLTPSTLLSILVEEIRDHRLESDITRRILLERLGVQLADRSLIPEAFARELGPLVAELKEGRERLDYISALARRATRWTADGRYFRHILEELKDTVCSTTTSDAELERIASLSTILISEFLKKGYSTKRISQLSHEVLASLVADDLGKNYRTLFPIDLFPEFPEVRRQATTAAENESLKAAMSGLTANSRLEALWHFLSLPPSNMLFVFDVEGLIGKSFDISIGQVNFYSKHFKRYLIEKPILFREPENDDRSTDTKAAMWVACADTDIGRNIAARMADSALDLLRCYYQPKAPWRVASSSYVVGDEKGRTGWSHSTESDPAAFARLEGLDLDRYQVDETIQTALDAPIPAFFFSNSVSLSKDQRKVVQAAHWYRRSIESSRPTDRLLNLWIACEQLFDDLEPERLFEKRVSERKRIGVVQEMLTVTAIRTELLSAGWSVFRSLRHSILWRAVTVPTDLAQRAGLEGTGRVSLTDFVPCLEELSSQLAGSRLKLQVDALRTLYGRGKPAYKAVERRLTDISDAIALAYRCRNRIVHNASADDLLTIIFAARLRELVGPLLRSLLRALSAKPEASVSEILIDYYARGRAYIIRARQLEKLKESNFDLLTDDMGR